MHRAGQVFWLPGPFAPGMTFPRAVSLLCSETLKALLHTCVVCVSTCVVCDACVHVCDV